VPHAEKQVSNKARQTNALCSFLFANVQPRKQNQQMVFARRVISLISLAQVQVVSELLSLGTALCCTTLCLAHGLKFSQTGLLMAHACPKSTVNSFVTQTRKPPKADTSMSRRSATLELSLPRFGKPRDSLPRPKRRKHPLKLLSCKRTQIDTCVSTSAGTEESLF